MTSILNNRQQKILDLLELKQKVQVVELAEQLAVSEVTIRKDLQELEENSLLKRIYGGAIAMRRSKYNPALTQRKINIEKQAIAQRALNYINDGDTLILDAGSSTFALAKLLPKHFKGLTIVTNSLPIINELNAADFEIVVLGGNVRQHSLALIGPLAVASLKQLHADKAFLGTTGVTIERCVCTPNIIEADTKRAMIAAASECIILADHSKIGQASLASYAEWSDIDVFISDRALPQHYEELLKATGVKVEMAMLKLSPLN